MLEKTGESRPFFTIGVPTFNRHDLLRETLRSVLEQGFDDFEIIVGNDYTAETLTCDMLGILDPRIRIVNYPENLKEVGNMNALLEMATGRYFTWLFDDDVFEPDFLQTAHECLVQNGYPPALFPSFRMLKVGEQFQPRRLHHNSMMEFTGREFLNWYSARRPQIGSTCGLFDTLALRNIVGGVENLCASTIGIYCEYLFLVKCALLGRIMYIDAPFYVYRRHAESWSESNVDIRNYEIAGNELLRKCSEVLQHPELSESSVSILLKIWKIHLITFAYVASRFEFARKKVFTEALFGALKLHRGEYRRSKKIFAELIMQMDLTTKIELLKTKIFTDYIIIRLITNCFFWNRRSKL